MFRRVRTPPKRGTFCVSAKEQAHGTDYSGPLRCELDSSFSFTVLSDSGSTGVVFLRPW